MKIGSWYLGHGRTEFTVWAPGTGEVRVCLTRPRSEEALLRRENFGYWRLRLEGVGPGARYFYVLDDSRMRPDPASHFQPLGVRGPSEIVDHGAFRWDDAGWTPPGLDQLVLYELHVGAFTPAGDFASIEARLSELRDLGVTALSLLPVAQFPGERNWGYDGTFPFAVQNSYGGPEGLKWLVNSCHAHGLAVVLDVVYNHLGPEGNVLPDFGPYLSGTRPTPWGEAVNFDQAWSDEVRNYFIENAWYWAECFHVDGLRLDAIHAMHDESARPFLRHLAEEVESRGRRTGRRLLLIAESDLNDVRVIAPRSEGGDGLDAQFCDDFHHALHVVLTGERGAHYVDFGGLDRLAKSLREGYVYTWDYSLFRRRHHGSSTAGRPAAQFIVFSQNHDQVGNRPRAERLASLVPFEALKVAAGAVILSPFVPLLFMGEEYGEDEPFHYFVSSEDPALIEAIREGRRAEREAAGVAGEPLDPQDERAFLESKLRWERRGEGASPALLRFYRELLRLRRETPALERPDRENLDVAADEDRALLSWRRWRGPSQALVAVNFSSRVADLSFNLPPGRWDRLLDSADPEWLGPGRGRPDSFEGGARVTLNPMSLALFVHCPGSGRRPGSSGPATRNG